MNDAKYIGLDVHQATISVAVRDSTGKLVMEAILETEAETILQCFRGLRGSLHVNFEEGAWAAWLRNSPPTDHSADFGDGAPKEGKSRSVPTDNRLRAHDHESLLPFKPELSRQDPEDPIEHG